jgi:hypothetical protein
VRLLLVKHPLRHAASYVEKARRVDRLGKFASIDTVLEHQYNFYREARTQPFDIVLRYEDLVTNLRAALTPVLRLLDLDYDPAIDAWQSGSHHYIGGNSGPASQLTQRVNVSSTFLRQKYSRSGIFLDNSFSTLFTPAEIEEVLAHPRALAMCDEFGYEPRITLD